MQESKKQQEQALEKSAEIELSKLREIEVNSPETYAAVGELSKVYQKFINQIGLLYDDEISLANKLHKSLLAKKKALSDKFTQALFQAKRMMDSWRDEQETLRLQREQEETARAHKEEIDRAVAQAAELEKLGDVETAVQIVEEAVVQRPIPVSIQSWVPKIEGISARKKAYIWEIADESKIPDQYWIIDEDAIKSIVKANGPKAEKLIPGIRVKEGGSSTAVSGK